MKVLGLLCKNCNTIIYSRASHDFHWCRCPDWTGCFVDGGMNYFRCGAHPECVFVPVIVDLGKVSHGELYLDWNNKRDLFGKEKPEDVIFEIVE